MSDKVLIYRKELLLELFGRQVRLLPITEMYQDMASFVMDLEDADIDFHKLANSNDADFIHDVFGMGRDDEHWVARNS